MALRTLLYGISTSIVVTLSNHFHGSKFPVLYFADNINASSQNPPSSNPVRLLMDYMDIVRTNDLKNPKFIVHTRAVKLGIRKALGPADRPAALQTVRQMGVQAMNPYLVILDKDAYENNHGTTVRPVPPSQAGSPTSTEYRVVSVQGPGHSNPEMYVEALHF